MRVRPGAARYKGSGHAYVSRYGRYLAAQHRVHVLLMPYDCSYYSSTTNSKVSIEMLRKITSKAMIKPSQGGSLAAGTMRAPVARTAPMTTGTIKGKIRSGSNNSRAWVADAMAENKVPTEAMPSVPSRTMGSSDPANKGTLDSAATTGSATSSTTPIKSRLPRSFAR